MARKTSAALIDVAAGVLETEAQALLAARCRIGKDFLSALDLLLSRQAGGRVVLMGMGKSGHVARKIAATFASTGTPAIFVHPAEAGHGDLGMITRGDVVIGISQSGKSDELLRILPYLKRNGISLLAMTSRADSPLSQHADAWIDTSIDREACPLGLAPTASTTLALALGDAIAMCLLEAQGFTSEMFAATHPHGALGRKLLVRVSDVMVVGDDLPITRSASTVRTALNAMSRAGLGFCAVLDGEGSLCGVFTDGDLRRALDRDVEIRATLIGAVIADRFVTIRESQLAAEAVELMDQRKISALPVIDDAGALVGAVNMRLLLRAGVV